MLIKLPKYLILIILSLVILGLSIPLDQKLAIIPYNSNTHLFYGETHTWCKVIYYSVNVATSLLIIIPLILLFKARNLSPAKVRKIKRLVLITYLSLAIGPGLIANSWFKDNWGRARPYQVIRDHQEFTYPWQPEFNQPTKNSFPSGHVTIGMFIGLPFICYGRRRLGVILSLVGFVLVGLVRYLQGGHYFSDICMAGIIVVLVYNLVADLVDYFSKRKTNG